MRSAAVKASVRSHRDLLHQILDISFQSGWARCCAYRLYIAVQERDSHEVRQAVVGIFLGVNIVLWGPNRSLPVKS